MFEFGSLGLVVRMPPKSARRPPSGVTMISGTDVIVDNPNVKGNTAELAIALAAAKLNLPIFRPLAEHGRSDLVLEVGARLYRVQCKWGRLVPDRSAISIGLEQNRCTTNGYVRTR